MEMSATSSTRLSPSPNVLQVNEPRRYGSTLSLEEKCEQSFFLFYYYRMEDEAVLDRGASLLKHKCDEEEVEGKCPCSSTLSFLDEQKGKTTTNVANIVRKVFLKCYFGHNSHVFLILN